MSTASESNESSVPTTTKVVVISSVMFVFISYWRVAAIVLCDLASTAFYIGGIVEHSIGPAAPWFIVGVMLFSYAVRSVYIESCSMFVRGGVYRIVKESLGRTTAKIAVAALLFDYVLTGPISGVSAGQYLMSLFFELLQHAWGIHVQPEVRDFWKAAGSVVIACLVTLYFFRLNVIGIHESSDKALKIMVITTVMGATVLGWSLLTLAIKGPQNPIVFQPTFTPKENPATGQMESPLGFIEGTSFANSLQGEWHWLSLLGAAGFFIAFGHSVLAMSGEETLAQIYREVESPKLKNFKRAAFIVFIYSLLLTGGISVLAVLLIPDAVRMDKFGDNLIGGLAMHVYGPPFARLLLNAFVVCVGSLILAGAVNTAIIGSNGVLNRVAEDGVIPDFLLKPHPRFGTTYRLLYVILGLQLFTIVISRGDVLLLGEAYAFGVVWSFVFNSLAMVVLRFRDPDRPRGFKVPLNIKIGGIEYPIGLMLIFVTLLICAIANVLTKETATIAGLTFTIVLFAFFVATERLRQNQGQSDDDQHEHLDEFNELVTDAVTPESLKLTHPYRKVVAIRSTAHLEPLDKVLAESDPETTDIVTMTVHVRPPGGVYSEPINIDVYAKELMNAVEKRAETAGKTVVPIIVSTNDVLHAVMQTVHAIGAQELLLGTSERFTPNEQLDRCAVHWSELHNGEPAPLTIRIVGQNRDFTADIGGGNRIPVPSDQRCPKAPVDWILFGHDGTPQSSDLLHLLSGALDRSIGMKMTPWQANGNQATSANKNLFNEDLAAAGKHGRSVQRADLGKSNDLAKTLAKMIQETGIDIVIVPAPIDDLTDPDSRTKLAWADALLKNTDCRVLFAIEPQEITQGK